MSEGGAAGGYGPALSRLQTRGVDERSVGFLVAGASHVAAQAMLPAIRQQPPVAGSRDVAGAWVAALYSHNERRARDFASAHAIIHAGNDLEALLQRREIQCVYVGSHPRHHAETVQAALAAHKHVLCEPPLALEYEEAERLQRMAENRGLVLALNYTWRAAAAIHRVHDLLASEAIGELIGGRLQNALYLPPERQTWRLQPNGGGVLWDRSLHDLDLLRYLLHANLRELFGRAAASLFQGAVEDDVTGYAVLTGGLVVQFHDSFAVPFAPVSLELYGANGFLRAVDCGVSPVGAPEIVVQRRSGVERLAVEAVNPYRAATARFLAAVRGLAPPLADGRDELHNLAALATLRRATEQGTAQRVAG